MDEGVLVRKFIEADMQPTKDTLEVLLGREDAEAAAERVLAALRCSESRPFIITPDIVAKILEGKAQPEKLPVAQPAIQTGPEDDVKHIIAERKLPELSSVKFKPVAAEYDARVDVRKDITGRSYSEGELKDFLGLFRDRYERLSRILRGRVELQDALPMGSLRNMEDRAQVKVIGIVSGKRESSKGNTMIDLEDGTGRVSVLVFKEKGEISRKAAEVVVDEVIGVVGSLRSGDRAPRIFAVDIIWPDLPMKHELHRSEDPVCAALISDLHVGSEMFLEDTFSKFVKWIQGGTDGPRGQELAGRVKYLVIAGDVVDGIGVYPEQEKELLVGDIFKQYDIAAKLLSQIPEHITIVIAPGNHDAVRPSEPQPAIPKNIAEGLYGLNSVMVGNPSWVSLHGVNFIVYHGRSFDDIVSSVPGLDRVNPANIMIKLLQKRHLAPIYGGRTAISPEQHDYMVIEEAPDVFHCGHVHREEHTRYRDVSVINSGTFQSMTDFMRRLGVEPTPGIVPVFDLKNHKVEAMRFA